MAVRNPDCNCIYIIDVEATCWKKGQNIEQQEVIQIGVCPVFPQRVISTGSYEKAICKPESYLIQPEYEHSEITDFCTELTGITLADLKSNGKPFSDAMRWILHMGKNKIKNSIFGSWGFFDQRILYQDYKKKVEAYPNTKPKRPNPFTLDRWRNIQHDYALFQPMKNSRKSLNTALNHFDMKFEGEQHDAKWDAYNTARVYLRAIYGQRV